MENIKYGRRREGRWTPIRAKAQDTRANPNSSETHLVMKRWDIGLLRALNPRIMMMMMNQNRTFLTCNQNRAFLTCNQNRAFLTCNQNRAFLTCNQNRTFLTCNQDS